MVSKNLKMEIPTVLAVDVSASTDYVDNYFDNVEIIKNRIDPQLKLAWGKSAAFIESYGNFHENLRCGTRLLPLLKKLAEIPYEFSLVIVTDGCVQDVSECIDYQKTDLVRHVDIYFLGKESNMNLEINSIFENVSQKAYINMELAGHVEPEWDLKDLNIDEFMHVSRLTFIAKVKHLNADEKKLLCRQFRNYEKNEMRKMDKEKSEKYLNLMKTMYAEKNISEFEKFISRFKTHDHSDLQREVQFYITSLTDDSSVYSLSNIRPIKNTVLKSEEDSNKESKGLTDIECDILYEKCHHLCMLIQKPKEALFTRDLKLFADNPFELLNHPDELNKFIQHIEYHKMDLKTFQKIKSPSPFTRKELKGAFILHGKGINLYDMLQFNARSLSILFGHDDKLPGSPALWNMVALYAVANHHPVWKQYRDLLYEEIRYIAHNTNSYIALSRMYPPNFITPLDLALWYCVEVSHLVFTNSKANRLRALGKPFYQFYANVFGTPRVDETLLDKWRVWEYMVKNQSTLDAEVLAQFQNHEVIHGKLVFFEGACENRYDCFLKNYDPDMVYQLYRGIEKNHAKMYQDVSKFHGFEFKISPVTKEKTLDTDDHVQIHLETCQPLVICPVTGKHWKECVGEYDVATESDFRLFRRYCEKFQTFPESVADLVLYNSERQPKTIYQKEYIYNVLGGVLDKFRSVMQKYTCVEYLAQVKKYQSESKRLEVEKQTF